MRMSSIAAAATAVMILAGTPLTTASAAPPKCADVGGTLGPGQLCQIQVNDPNYTMNIGFPADYPDQKSLIDYVKQTRDGYLNMAKTPDGRPAPYVLETKPSEFNSGGAPTRHPERRARDLRVSRRRAPDHLLQGVQLGPGLPQGHHHRHPVPGGHRAVRQ